MLTSNEIQKMKKSLYILTFALVALLGLSSCDSYFDINLDDQATLEEMFSKKSTTRQYLAHCYSFIPYDERPRSHDGGVMMRSDEVLFGSSSYPTAWYYYRSGDYSPATAVNRESGNCWSAYYQAITQCTTFLQYVHLDMEDSEEVKTVMAAEARFLRAYYYFCLFRWYGPVYVWGDNPADENILGHEIDRHPVETVVDFIVDELDKAAADLPMDISEIADGNSNMGRATKGAALALKARVLLYAASPLYNGNDLYKSMTNYYGEKLFPQEYDGNKWELAAQAAKAVIDLNQYSLCTSTATGDAFKDGAASYQKVMFEPWNEETIGGWWSRTVNDWEGAAGSILAYSIPNEIGMYGYELLTPSLKLMDTYPMWESGRYPVKGYQKDANGLDLSKPIVDEKSGYVAEGFTEDYQQVIDVDPSWATPIKAHNSTIGRDPRFYASYVPNGFWWPSNKTYDQATSGTTGPKKTLLNEWYQTSGNVNRVGYVWRRLYKANNPVAASSDYTSMKYVYPAFRLAEVYLSYAEACNEKPERNEAEAIKYLNMVRNRAGLNNIEDAYPGEINKETLRWFIRQEKMVEFAMEGHRWYDLTRTMTAKDEIPAGAWTLSLDQTSDYEASWVRTSTLHTDGPIKFKDRDYLFPLGNAQLSEMTNVTQNYGF